MCQNKSQGIAASRLIPLHRIGLAVSFNKKSVNKDPVNMRAMLFEKAGQPLRLADVPVLRPSAGQLLIRVRACAVCRTDLHVVDGELSQPKLPLIPGHEIVGTVAEKGEGVARFAIGDRVGRRISAIRQSLPATRSTAAMPNTLWPISAFAFQFQNHTVTQRRRPCCVRD
jgi:NADPH:quinone reductase-like Zn-dependent oxidoreductase